MVPKISSPAPRDLMARVSACPRPSFKNKDDQASNASTREPSEELSEFGSERRSGLIVFDWDDTLFPTSSGGSHFELKRHAATVEALLREAAALGKVCIVTMAERGWVQASAERFLPTLRLPELLLELDIAIYCAREHRPSVPVAKEQMHMAMKMTAMSLALRESYSGAKPNSEALNVLSIGDSDAERTALHELLAAWSQSGALAYAPSRKTVKLMERPHVSTLTQELEKLRLCLDALHAHCGNLDLVANSLADFDAAAFGKFASPCFENKCDDACVVSL